MNNGPELVKEYVSAKKRVISPNAATRQLNENESGSAVLFDRAAGTVYTLPAACLPGTFFDFYVSVTCTSNAHKIITGAGTELMVGQILNCDTDTSDAVAIWKSLVATSNIAVSMNGTTKGGVKGDVIRVTKLDATTWGVHGQINGNGTVATPFATS
jgi:hypothetical protein